MRFSTLLASMASGLLFSGAVAVTGPGARIHDFIHRGSKERTASKPQARNLPRSETGDLFLNNKTAPYAVDGKNFPSVNFDLGESYSGLLPISANLSDPRELFFWFFPSANPSASNEIVIWLTGGPGCSSLNALLTENGPFLWQPGVYEPFANPYSWTNLTNMVWIDQPYGVGLSQGKTFVKDDSQAAQQLIAFWKHFVDLFDMYGYKIYVTGESYGGRWVPYTAAAMLEQNDTTYYDVAGISIFDPTIGDDTSQFEVIAYPYLEKYNVILNINDTYMETLKAAHTNCGYEKFLDTYLTFPPPGLQPTSNFSKLPKCDVQDNAYEAMLWINPCFNIYHITDNCPFVWAQSDLYNYAAGPSNFFNRSDVQAALHVPETDYTTCESAPGLLYNDADVDPILGPLPLILERTNNVIIGNGDLDFLIPSNGTLLAIQNMTWNGAQGFQSAPPTVDNFYVPYDADPSYGSFVTTGGNSPEGVQFTRTDGGGLAGTWHTERGLTWITLSQAGHQTPQYVPGASYRHLEFLLGRISSLNQTGDFTTQGE